MSDDFDRRLDALRYSLAEQMTRIAARLDAIEHRLFAAENTLDAWRETSDRALRSLETRMIELEAQRRVRAVTLDAAIERRLHLVETAVTIARGTVATAAAYDEPGAFEAAADKAADAMGPITDAESNAPR